MLFATSIIILLLTPELCQPRFTDSDDYDDEHQLLRNAYATIDDETDNQDDDLELGKIDPIKDGLWVIRAKLKEINAFTKALAANLVLTNLKLKEIIENQINIKKHQHNIPEKKNFYHKYQPQPYQLQPGI